MGKIREFFRTDILKYGRKSSQIFPIWGNSNFRPKSDIPDCVFPGPATVVCAETLRQEGFTGRIVLLSQMKHLPYERIKLSKVVSFKINTHIMNSIDCWTAKDHSPKVKDII